MVLCLVLFGVGVAGGFGWLVGSLFADGVEGFFGLSWLIEGGEECVCLLLAGVYGSGNPSLSRSGLWLRRVDGRVQRNAAPTG